MGTATGSSKSPSSDTRYGGWVALLVCTAVGLAVFWASGLFGVPPFWLGTPQPGPREYAKVGWILALIPGFVAIVNYWVAEAPRAARTGTSVELWLRSLYESHKGDARAKGTLSRLTMHLDNLVTNDPPRFAYTLFGALLLTMVFGIVAQFADGPYGIGVKETSSLGGREAPPSLSPSASPTMAPTTTTLRAATGASAPPAGAPPATAAPGAAAPTAPAPPVVTTTTTTLGPASGGTAAPDSPVTPPRDVGREAATAYSPVPEQKGPVSGETIRGLVFSGLGAYVFALQLLIGRINAGSLTGRFLIRLATQSAIAIVLGVAAAQIGVGFAIGTERQTLFLYFALGLFPGLVRQALSRRGRVLFAPDEPVCENLPLCFIDGIDDDIIDRLSEMGISDVQHLATVDPVEFMLKAGYAPMRVLDWIDQAIFMTYVRRRIVAARAYGIRGAIDFAVLYTDYQADQTKEPPDDPTAARARVIMRSLAIRMEMPTEVLLQIGRAVWEDETVQFIWQLWMNRVFWGTEEDGDDDSGEDDDGGGGGPAVPSGGSSLTPDAPTNTAAATPVVGLNLTKQPVPGPKDEQT